MMTGTEVDLRLSELQAVVLAVGEQAHATLGRAVEALVRRDTAAASAVIAGDDVIEGQCAAVTTLSAQAIALPQLSIGELRTVLVALALVESVERITRHARDIAHVAATRSVMCGDPLMRPLSHLATLVQAQVQEAIGAYRSHDAAWARDTRRRHREVEDVYVHLVQALRRQGGGDDERALLRVAHHLARISEHVLAMCERVIAIGRDEHAEAIADGDGRAVVEPPVVMPC